ncbi:YesL family protein [Sporosarcina sp. YIM B06819]|uniref:YesL family protein n=1 Tax=Sporosarcina sp. YIM B06819 TaxID=3081769 RepID=UPI00298C7F12|nr:YesL family protein [Sporosarcina sp. YIM B06819]
MNRFALGFYHYSEWIVRLAYVNLLWIAFTIAGLGIFGFMPATISMFAVIRKWRMGEVNVPIWSTFWKNYKKEFIKSNVFGTIFFLIGYVLSIEFQILRNTDQLIYLIVSYGVLGLFLLLLITFIYFFPIFVHFKLENIQYLKWPFIMGIIHPILTIVLLVVIGGITYVTVLYMPGMLLFFGGSVIAYVLMWGVTMTFPKYESKTL